MGMTQEEVGISASVFIVCIHPKQVNLTPAVFDNGPSVGDSNVLEEDIMTSTGIH